MSVCDRAGLRAAHAAKKEQDYSLARRQGLVSSTAKLIQYPIVLAWAVTVHKFQQASTKYRKCPNMVCMSINGFLYC